MHVGNAAISSALLPGVIFTAALLCKSPRSLPNAYRDDAIRM